MATRPCKCTTVSYPRIPWGFQRRPSLKPMDGDLTGVHVLLVDDTEDVLEIFGSYLRHVGAVVTMARNGSEALACLAQARAHVIVTDLAMPGMDGVEFVARLRGDRGQGEAPTPVIAVTAFPD